MFAIEISLFLFFSCVTIWIGSAVCRPQLQQFNFMKINSSEHEWVLMLIKVYLLYNTQIHIHIPTIPLTFFHLKNLIKSQKLAFHASFLPLSCVFFRSFFSRSISFSVKSSLNLFASICILDSCHIDSGGHFTQNRLKHPSTHTHTVIPTFNIIWSNREWTWSLNIQLAIEQVKRLGHYQNGIKWMKSLKID